MSKEIPFSVKKTKSIFNSAMQEMEVYVENMRKKFGVFNYAPFRTPYTPDNNFQMLLDPSNPSSTAIKPEKQEKIKLSFDMTASPKMALARGLLSGSTVGGSTAGRRIPVSDMPRSPMSTNSSAHTGSDGEQETTDKSQSKASNSQHTTGEESMDCTGISRDGVIERQQLYQVMEETSPSLLVSFNSTFFSCTASPAHPRPGSAGTSLDGSKPVHSQVAGVQPAPKQDKTPPTGSILNLNLGKIHHADFLTCMKVLNNVNSL